MGRSVAPYAAGQQTSMGVRTKDKPESSSRINTLLNNNNHRHNNNNNNNNNNHNTNVDDQAPPPPPPASSSLSSSLPLPQSLNVTDNRGSAAAAASDKDGVLDSRDEDDNDHDNDDDDDDEEDGSSLGYSDDSASLGDVYFLPGDDLARPATYREQDPYLYSPDSSIASPQMLFSPAYGSVTSSSLGGRTASWLGGPIQEDMETRPEDSDVLFATVGSEQRFLKASAGSGTTLSISVKDRARRQRKQKKQIQRLQKRMKEQAARERAVSRIRGQPQEVTHWQDPFWAFLFVVQFVSVVLCALRFGFGVLLFKGTSPWGNYMNGQGNFFWDDHDHHRMLGETVAKSLPAGNSSSLSDILFHPSDPSAPTDDGMLPSPSYGTDFTSFTIDYKNVLALVFFTGLYACVLAYLSFGFMLIIARSLIQIMLIFSIVVALGWGLIGLSLDPYGLIADMGFGAFLLTLGYTMFSWNRIPFAATNLYTALCAMRCTADITILGLMSLVVAFSWCLLWCTAFVGIVNTFNNSDCNKKDDCVAHMSRNHIPLYLLLIFSFHWTTMVIKNVVRVTVASAVGTWWFRPSEIGPFCTAAVVRPLLRSMTKSFGSICLGSLIVQPAQILLIIGNGCCCVFGSSESQCLHPTPDADEEKQPLVTSDTNSGKKRKGRRSTSSNKSEGISDDELDTGESAVDSVGLCRRCCKCFLPLHRFVRACNRWSYTYIGMYGYSFTEAGARAQQLFQTRQWVEVVEDSLIQNVLLMASVVIGGSSGVFAVVVEETDGYDFTSFHQPIISAFVIGSVLGYVLSNILLLGVVGSAVNTILVCFAAGPFEFDKNHPFLSREMREVWSQQVWEPPV